MSTWLSTLPSEYLVSSRVAASSTASLMAMPSEPGELGSCSRISIQRAWLTSCLISSIGKSGARSCGPIGWPVPGCSTGGAGVLRSAWMLYHFDGMSFSSRRNLVRVVSLALAAIPASLLGRRGRLRYHRVFGRSRADEHRLKEAPVHALDVRETDGAHQLRDARGRDRQIARLQHC